MQGVPKLATHFLFTNFSVSKAWMPRFVGLSVSLSVLKTFQQQKYKTSQNLTKWSNKFLLPPLSLPILCKLWQDARAFLILSLCNKDVITRLWLDEGILHRLQSQGSSIRQGHSFDCRVDALSWKWQNLCNSKAEGEIYFWNKKSMKEAVDKL